MDKKDLLSELNKCQDISKYSEKVRYIMENRKKYHKECEALEEYLTLHNKENPTKEQKFLKAKLKAELERFFRVLEVTSELEIPTATQFAVWLLRAMDCPFFFSF